MDDSLEQNSKARPSPSGRLGPELLKTARWRFGRGAGHVRPEDVVARLLERIRSGAAETIKDGENRTVWRVCEGRKSYYVKYFKVPTLLDHLRFAVTKTRGEAEWKALERAGRAGINVPRALALGVRRSGPFLVENVLVTEGLADVVDLVTLVLQDLANMAPQRARALLREGPRTLARLIRKMHDAEFDHRDLHAGNVLCRFEDDEPSFYMVDLHTVRHRKMDLRRRMVALARFGLFFRDWCGVAALARFFGEYFAADRLSRAERKAIWFELSKAMERERFELLRRHDRRPVRRNRYFAPVKEGEFAGWRRSELDHRALKRVMRGAGQLMQSSRVLKEGRSSKVVVVEDFPGGAAVLKRFVPRDAKKRVKNLLRPSRAARGWRNENALSMRRVSFPAPLAYWETTGVGFLLSRYLPDCEKLAILVREELPRWPARERNAFLERTAELFGRVTRRMHQTGCSHRDLKPGNVLIRRDGSVVKELFLVDADGVAVRYKRIPPRRRARDLARFAAPLGALHARRKKFLDALVKSYLGWDAGRKEAVREFLGLLREECERIMERKS